MKTIISWLLVFVGAFFAFLPHGVHVAVGAAYVSHPVHVVFGLAALALGAWMLWRR